MLYLILYFKYFYFISFLMGYTNRRKTLVDIDLSIWAKVRHFATMQKLSVNSAVERLLDRALASSGYIAEKPSQGEKKL